MGEFIIMLKFTQCHMGVYLGSGEALVSQQLLDAVELRAVVEHDARKGVAQHVGAELARASGLRQPVVNDVIHERGIQGLAPGCYQQVAALGPHLVTHHAVIVDPLRQLAAEGDQAVLVALAVHLELPLDGVDSRVLQADKLAQADARLVEEHHDEAVAHLAEVVTIDVGVKQSVDGLLADEFGQGLGQLGQLDLGSRIGGDEVFPQQITVECPEGLNTAAQGRRAVTMGCACHQPRPDVTCRDREQVKRPPAGSQVVFPQDEVTAIGIHRSQGQIALVSQVLQETLNCSIHRHTFQCVTSSSSGHGGPESLVCGAKDSNYFYPMQILYQKKCLKPQNIFFNPRFSDNLSHPDIKRPPGMTAVAITVTGATLLGDSRRVSESRLLY